MQIPDSLIQACDEVVPRTKPNRELFQFTVGYLAQFYESSKIMGMESVFVHLADKYFLTGEATWLTEANLKKIRERVMRLKPNLIGKLAPELLLTDSAGTKVSIRKINADYTILYFWSYDCGHCKKETPHYLDLYHKYKNKDVKFVGISTKLERDKWLNYIKEHQLDWYNLYDPTGQTRMHELYDIYSTPTIFLLDKDKKIIAKRINYEQIDMILDDLINKKQGKAIELKDEN
jgi:peroxiredoxin